jgi:tRNA pseudouridine38-40 synthase
MWVWYRGSFFRGFQSQREGPTVQESMIQSLSTIGVRSSPCPAGRTDKGVHARMQVLSLRLRQMRPEELLRHLSPQPFPGFGICYARCAPDRFHAQWSSVGKEYRYRLRLDPCGAPRWTSYSWAPADHPRLSGRKINLERLARALQCLEGTHDFAAFHENSSPRRPRTIGAAELIDRGAGLVDIRVLGDRFARHQVRFMVGSAVAVSAGTLSEDQFLEAVERAQRVDGIKAPAAGLVLWEVHYPRALDPFDPLDRAHPDGLPSEPPFID